MFNGFPFVAAGDHFQFKLKYKYIAFPLTCFIKIHSYRSTYAITNHT